ncbi:hypothetical protein PAEAM_01800 [Paenibacillus sp. GM1FR]|nr:hypothetical protein PAEAM_01800 [Paenibacillus sp. GM1FR]
MFGIAENTRIKMLSNQLAYMRKILKSFKRFYITADDSAVLFFFASGFFLSVLSYRYGFP